MIQRKKFTHEIGGKTLTLEVSAIAEQANAAVIGKYGGTAVLATVVMSKKDVTLDYLPLKVDYEERFYAAGKIIGSRFIRREGRPSEDAILTGRLIDRTIRPLFDYRMRRDVQVVVTVLAYDGENDPDFLSVVCASAAIAISDVPWGGPVAGVRIARAGSETKVNPDNTWMQPPEFAFETFASGPKGKINMIELTGNEVSEEEAGKAYVRAQEEIDKLVAFQEKIVAEIGKPKETVALFAADAALKDAVAKFLEPHLASAVFQSVKTDQQAKLAELKKALHEHVQTIVPEAEPKIIDHLMEDAIDVLVHREALDAGRRPDGRGFTDVRTLNGEVALFGRTHGSALFVRGSTQALAVTTLAAPGADQLVESMKSTGKRRFMLHYNFPPYSVGEVGMFRGPGRREIGHGALAEKAVRRVIPEAMEFPYTVRVVSEILSSNGSSSMATVCATILSLLDAGVPLKKMVGGIAMGLMSDGKRFKVLTDLQGYEDFYGDMDFKVAGTPDGITAIQLDTKIAGLTNEIIVATLVAARDARMKILDFMKTIISAPRAELSEYVPKIRQLSINPDRIGLVIGPGGKTINGMIAKYGLASIDIEEDGSVFVSGIELAAVEQAVAEIKAMTREFKIGEVIEGRVIKTLDFGAIVDLGGGKDGMVHVSELKSGGFVKTVTEVVNVGDVVRAKIIRADDDGRIGLSIKQLDSAQ
jgi:polyribonucleotide nucleotidyltransferase